MTKPKTRPQGRPSINPGEPSVHLSIRGPASLASALSGFTQGQKRAALIQMVEDSKITRKRKPTPKGAAK